MGATQTKRAIFAALLALIPSLGHANFQAQGIEADGVRADNGVAVGGYDQCSSLIAGYTLDEIGTADRVPYAGTCGADCTMNADGDITQDNASWCRGAYSTENQGGTALDCPKATCDETEFVNEDFSVTGLIRGTRTGGGLMMAGNWNFSGWALQVGTQATPQCNFVVFGSGVVIANCDASNDFIFLAGTNDHSELDIGICAGGNAATPGQDGAWWECNQNLSANAVNASTADLHFASQGGTYDPAPDFVVDEIHLWNVPLTEAEMCFICSCRANGTGCRHDGAGNYTSLGRNGSYCGGCTLPTLDSNGDPTCPS